MTKFSPGDRVRKIGGTYQADGTIVGVANTLSGEVRYVFEFADPPGMLHIFNEGQLARGHVQPLPPVEGDLLPAIGSKVLIHLARQDAWVEHTVVGYYVWGPHTPGAGHRVNVRVMDKDGYLNARGLEDIRPVPPTPQVAWLPADDTEGGAP